MAQNFLAIAQHHQTERISLWIVVKHDFMPWLLSASFALLVFTGISLLVSSANANVSEEDAIAVLYSRAQLLYIALIAIAVFAARRSKSIWTWVLSVLLVIFFLPQNANNLVNAIAPNSIAQAIVAMIGFLATERLIEYIQMRYVIKLEKPTFSVGAWVGYITLILCVVILEAPLFFELLWN